MGLVYLLRMSYQQIRSFVLRNCRHTYREADVLRQRALGDIGKWLIGTPTLHIFGHFRRRPVSDYNLICPQG